jgi:uncharacterized OB-fold protein
MRAEPDVLPAGAAEQAGPQAPLCWKCAACGLTSYPDRGRCPECWSEEGATEALPTEGEIHTFTTVYVGPPGTDLPYTVGYVDLGPVRVFARLLGEPQVGGRARLQRVEPRGWPRPATFVFAGGRGD